EGVVRVADPAGLRGASRGVVLRIEVEDDGAPAQRREADALAAVGRQLELRRRLPLLDHARIVLTGARATLPAMRIFRDMNPTLRGFLLIGLVALIIV